jgi:uncharacterized protein
MNNSTQRPLAAVTGASSGIGKELAKVFAENGFDLIICAEDPGINSAAAELQASGAQVRGVQADLANYDGVEQFYREIQATGRPLDAAALNAGVGVGGPFLENDLDAELNIVKLNALSTVHLAKRVVQDMAKRGSGRILFTSSIAATMPGPFEAVYNASKAFVSSFAEGIRSELKDTGVSVTALMPGATDTNFFHRAGNEDTKLGAGPKDDAAEVAREGFEALMAGKDKIVAGSFKNRVQAAAGNFLPETVVAEMHRKMSEPGSANK